MPIESLADVFKLIGIDPEKTYRIEGIGINRGAISRYRISNSYDMIIFVKSLPHVNPSVPAPEKHTPIKRNAIFQYLFFIPHSDEKYDGKLFTRARWNEVIFK
jgi:hypothetical protein